MYYLTIPYGFMSINDDITIFAGDLEHFLDNGSISSGTQSSFGLRLTKAGLSVTLSGNQAVPFIEKISTTSLSGPDVALFYEAGNGYLNFAAESGAAKAGTVNDRGIAIAAIQGYTASASYPGPTTGEVIGISSANGSGNLTVVSAFSGVVTADASADHKSIIYNTSGKVIEIGANFAVAATGVKAADLYIVGNYSGATGATAANNARSRKTLSVSGNKSVSKAFSLTGDFVVNGAYLGDITTSAAFTGYANYTDFIAEGTTPDKAPASASASSLEATAIGIASASVAIGEVWNGTNTAEVSLVNVSATASKTGADAAATSVTADSGTVQAYSVKTGQITVGKSLDGVFSAEITDVKVGIGTTAEKGNGVISASNWNMDAIAISGTTMQVGGTMAGNFTAVAHAAFTGAATTSPDTSSTTPAAVSATGTLDDNTVDVIGINVTDLTVADMLSSVISATGTLQLTSASSGGNTAQGGVNSTSIRNNVLTVAGILSNSITVGGAISTSITAYGSMGTKVTSGSINNANDPSAETGNRLNVYGIKTDSLVCSDFSGVITVNSRNTDSNPALRNSRVNSFITIQTVGLYVDQSINGGDPDTAMNISGVISVTAENGGVAAGIMGGFSGINITISGSIIVNAFGVDIDQNPVSGPAFAVYCGDYTQRSFNGLNGAAFENYVTKAIDDRVEITAGAQVVGDFQLSTGTNYVTIDSRASVIGDLMSMGGTLNLQFNLVGAALSNPILTANTDFASAQCSISTFTIDINEAESGRYQLMNDAGGVNYKWVGREVSLIYNGQTYVTTVGFEASAAISYLNGVDGFGFKVFLSTDNKTIIAEMVEASPNLSVGPGIGAPVIDLNSATLSWQDMSVAYDPANPVDPDSTIAGVAWDGRQVARYELEFSVSNDFSNAMSRYIYGDSTGYAATDIVISGLAVGDYFWRVRTLYADGTLSGWSDDAGPSATFTVVNKLFYTTPDVIDNTTMAAVDPNGAAGKFSNSVVKLDWADSTAATGINYYVVEYYSSTDKADYYISADQTGWDQWVADGGTVNTRMISASELILSGLGNYTNLHWRVKAVANDLGGNLDNVPTEGEWSYYQNPIVVWVGDKTAPTAASKLDVNAIVNADDPSKIDMELLWNVSNDAQSGVQRYIVQYGLSQDWSDPANYTELMVSGSAAQLTPDGKITIPGLGETLNNQCYYWRVQAVDYVGNSSSWVEGKTFIIDMTAPTDPVLIDVATSGTTSLGADGITFNWKPSEDASTLTYDIQISASGDFSSDFYAAAIGVDGVADTSGNLSFTISGADFATLLTNSGYSFADGVMFHWRVKAFDHPVGASYSNESNWVSGQFAVDLTDDTAPVGPTTISLSQVPGQRSISVTWTPAADNKTPQAELKYLVYYKAAGDTAWTQRVADTNSFTLTGVEEGKEYFFKVSAIDNASNVGAESAEASIICDATAPTNNAGLASLVTSGPNGSIVLSWNVATDAGDAAQSFNTNYELQYSTSYLFTPGAGLHTITVNSGNMVVANGRVTLTVSGAELAGFADLTTYFWRIQAVDHAGNKSAFSAGTDKFVAPDVTAPTEPANLTMVRVPNQQMTRFQWDASADNSRSVSYILSYWTNPDKSDIQSVTVTGTSKDLALAAGPVFWSVQAVDNVGNKSVATEAGGTVDYIAPYIPSARVAAVNQTTRAVTLSWTPANPDDAAPGSGLAKYEIRYSNTSAYNPDDTVTVTVDGALSEYVLGSNLLKDAETYYWQIRAIDHNGNASVWNDGAGAIFIAPDTTNATGDAKPISVGQTLNERIGGPKDPADYYYLSLGQTGNYTFTVTSNATTVGITLVNLANNQTISYRSGQTVDLLAGNYRVGITNSGASVEYTFNSTANTIYSVNNNDDTWNNVANNSQIVMTANESARSGEANDWVGFGDLTDYYKLVLDKAGTYTLAIDGLDNNAVMTLYLVNAAGTAVSTQSGWSTTAQVYRSSSGVTITNNKLLDKLLAAGTYYVKVDRTGTTSTNYRVGVTGTAFPTDNTDDSVALVESLVSTDPDDKHKLAVSADGVISGYSDWAGFGDTTDFYTFTLSAKGTYVFELGALTNRASFSLLQKTATGTTQKANFSVTPSATVSGARTALLNLDEGTYYIQVTATDGNVGKNTGYSVGVTGQGAPAGEDDNSATTAFVNNNPLSAATGELNGSFSDWVGFGDVSDFRMIGLAQGAVSLTVSVDIENPATVYLYRVTELNAGPGTSLGSITPTLTFGTDGSLTSIRNNVLTINAGSATDMTTYKYYVEVRSTGAATGKNTDYTVITSGGTNDINAADNTQAGAQMIALDADGVAAAIHDGGIGYGDNQDYYKLVLAKDGVYGFSIDGLTGSTSTVTLRLLNSSGSQLKTVTVNLAAGDNIGFIDNQLLRAGTYYLNVNGPNAGFSAYDLTIDGAYNQAGGNSRETALDLDFAVVPPSGGAAARMAAPVDLSSVVTMGGSAGGWVGAGDTVDFYRFSVESDGNYNYAFRGIDNAAVLTIYAKSFNSLGQEISSTALGQINSRGKAADLSLLLTSGDYYVEVSSANASNPVNTNYYIDATATTFATLQVNGLNAIDFAASGSTTCRFDLAMAGDISLSIDGDAALVRYSLYHKVGNELVEIKSSNRAGDLNVKDLDAGTYFVKINYAGAGAANFELALDLPDQVPPAAGSLSLDAAVDGGQSAGLQLTGVDSSELSFGLSPAESLSAAGTDLSLDAEKQNVLKLGLLA